MVWVYDHTGGSLPAAMLMHMSLTFFTIIVFPPSAVMANLISGYAFTAVLWAVVGAVALANHRHLSRQPPLRRQVA
jgi:hypothetical protein